MKNSKYSEGEVLSSLARKRNSLKINMGNKVIQVSEKPGTEADAIGIKTRGKLSFLKNYCNWIIMYQ